jgi:hypothetical protein
MLKYVVIVTPVVWSFESISKAAVAEVDLIQVRWRGGDSGAVVPRAADREIRSVGWRRRLKPRGRTSS